MVDGFAVAPWGWTKEKALWVTADLERIGSRLKAICPPEVGLVEKRMLPMARQVGWLGVVKRDAGVATEGLLPVYVHPAVAAMPELSVPDKHEEIKGKI